MAGKRKKGTGVDGTMSPAEQRGGGDIEGANAPPGEAAQTPGEAGYAPQSEGSKTPEVASGLECPSCGCAHLPVDEERDIPDGQGRTRVCRNCGKPLRTIERDETDIQAAEQDRRDKKRTSWGGSVVGLVCKRCQGTEFEVRDTDRLPGRIRRYRICKTCGYQKTTFEQ